MMAPEQPEPLTVSVAYDRDELAAKLQKPPIAEAPAKPGDVAMVTVEGFDPQRAIFTDTGKWRDAEDCRLSPDASDTTYRRLAVIDPESPDDMVRLSKIWHALTSAELEDDMSLSVDGWRLRLALREFAKPAPVREGVQP